jgi:hypothetical protein
MAHMPEDTTQNNNLTMTGMPVLVQNQLGIFYGTLEKADTRTGTALLTNGFMLSPERHITFLQYLNFLNGVVSDVLMDIAGGEYDSEDDGSSLDPWDIAEKLFPNEISIANDEFLEHKRDISITDYAAEGVALVQFRTRAYSNTEVTQATSPSISLTGVIAIVAIDPNTQVVHKGLSIMSGKDASGLGIIESLLGWDIPEFEVRKTFEILTKSVGNIEDTDFLNLPKLVVNTNQRVNHLGNVESDG